MRAAPDHASIPAPLQIRGLELRFGTRTYVMGIVNATPDSFSGDGLLRDGEPTAEAAIEGAVAQAVGMVAEGADILDVGGESTRPGHEPVDADEELGRVLGVIGAMRSRLPTVPISIDTRKPGVAEAASAAGADIINDVAAVTAGAALAPIAAAHDVPYVLVHDREQPEEGDVVAGVLEDLQDAIDLAVASGCRRGQLIVDPGIGFGKTAQQNLELLSRLAALRALGLPVLLGASRKSTIGRVLDLPVEERLEGTLAITALAVAAGIDIVRVHDVRANVRVARMSDAIVRGGRDASGRP